MSTRPAGPQALPATPSLSAATHSLSALVCAYVWAKPCYTRSLHALHLYKNACASSASLPGDTFLFPTSS